MSVQRHARAATEKWQASLRDRLDYARERESRAWGAFYGALDLPDVQVVRRLMYTYLKTADYRATLERKIGLIDQDIRMRESLRVELAAQYKTPTGKVWTLPFEDQAANVQRIRGIPPRAGQD